jgi:pyruvate,water dikinase
VYQLETIENELRSRFGAKAVNLGRLMRAGLPVPPGFCFDETVAADDAAVVAAYRGLGGGFVAVRSSAAGEDEASASAAGLFATRLGVRGEDDLAAAVETVRRSAHAAHVRTYQSGGPPLQMAVIVQRQVEADAAGVVFTRDPADVSGNCLAIAAARGLGTAVVGGAEADRIRLDRASGRVAEKRIAHKRLRHTPSGVETVPADRAEEACLTPDQIRELAALALTAEVALGEPCDAEWALADGRFWLLQARPITTTPVLDLSRLRRSEIERLRAIAEPGGTVWVRYQLAESAPRPTPMTWGVLRSLLSVRGGYGRMLRALGFDPDPAVDAVGFVQLIAGQPYLNLNLEARLDHRDVPYTIDVTALKRTPADAQLP